MTKKFLAIFLILTLGIIPCYAKDFVVNPKEKINYVNLNYFKQFNDEYLVNYIIKSIENNHDARIASYKVEEYRQNVKYSFGAELPTLSGAINYLGLKTPEFANMDIDKNVLVLPFIASYEADFLLKNRDKTRSVKKSYEASEEEERSIYISLANDIASTYLNILALDNKINLQRKIMQSKREIFLRTKKQFEQGTINAMTLNNDNKTLKQVENDLDELLKTRQKLSTQFAVLIGESPQNINNLKFGKFDNFGKGIKTPNVIPSDVIYSRPDVLAVEKKLEKAKIDIRIARKEFFPKFNITGIYAFNSLGAGSFFSWESTFAAIVAGATQDIFMGGRKIANLKIQKSKYEQIFEEYKQTDLTALKEVNDALYILKYDTRIEGKALSQLSLTNDNYKRYSKKYERGLLSYPNLLEEKINLLNTQQSYTTTRTTQLIDHLTLYKAVGGKL